MERLTSNKRNNSLDYLRCIACVLVCFAHVVSYWFSLGKFQTVSQQFVSSCYYGFAGMTIAIFVMLSGAFLLEKESTKDYRSFYRKSVSGILIPTLIFTVIYIIYKFPFCFIGAFKGVIPYLNQIYIGKVMAHMWYMYMIIVVYAMAPVVARFKESVSQKSFHIFSYIFLILSCICGYTSTHKFSWDLGHAFNILGFFVFGNVLYKKAKRNSTLYGVINISTALIILFINSYLYYRKVFIGDITYAAEDYFGPTAVLAAIFMVVGFMNLDIKRSVSRISSYTFEVYLIHLGVWETIYKVYDKFIGGMTDMNPIIAVPIWSLIVLFVSYFLARAYRKLFSKFDNRTHFTDKVLKLLRLNNSSNS